MGDAGSTWAIVLAGGEGSRLRDLTTTSDGVSVPKQYWSFDGERTLLHATLDRAARLVGEGRVVPVVSRDHARWWRRELQSLPRRQVVVQPENRGTAAGVLLPVLRIRRLDPAAIVVVLPSDHHVDDERVLQQALRTAVAAAQADRGSVVLLGITPEEPDPELGWIVAAPRRDQVARDVVAFVEKPDLERARSLMGRGALWSSFMFAATVDALLDLFGRTVPGLLEAMLPCAGLLAGDDPTLEDVRGELYSRLPRRDFSRDVLEACPGQSRVVSVESCGWTDLGTPARVAAWQRRRQAVAVAWARAGATPPRTTVPEPIAATA
jgi:mannose-1-phosphate guanylyltransferase